MSTVVLEGLDVECRLASDMAASGMTDILILGRDAIAEAATRLHKDEYVLEDVMVMHVSEGFQALYHFCHFDAPGRRVCLRVIVPQDDPKIPSISSIFHGAEWHERESMDFYGVEFTGCTNSKVLLLADDMADANPLRKEEKALKSYLDLLPPFTIVECPDDHPVKKLFDEREAAAKAAAEAEKKAAEEAKAKAEAKAAEEAKKAEAAKADEAES